MAEHVWVGSPDHPDWMRGGSYMVVRRIRMQLENWDHATLENQEQTIGRHKMSGAPLGADTEFAPLNPQAADAHGVPFMPPTSHVRLAHQGPERILRRGYSFSDGLDPITGGMEAGLLFICFQREPRSQFIPLQTRLSTLDALNEYIVHTGSALFACPPGAPEGGYVGEGLLQL